ncbi:MAG: hypothetical protein WAT79_05065 [Saprospiraceae bacterium]
MNHRSILSVGIVVCVLVLICLFSTETIAQCPMCKMSAESNLKDGGTMGKGLNTGILFLLSLPYIMVGSLGLIWYKNRKNYDETAE